MKMQKVVTKLNELGFEAGEILRVYNDPDRHYHNFKHILKMLEHNKDCMTTDLFLATIFHDIVYDPKRNDNEQKSADYFFQVSWGKHGTECFRFYNKQNIYKAIKATKDHKLTKDKLTNDLIFADLAIFRDSFEEIVKFEKSIFKEYQFVDWKTYKTKRLEVLEKFDASEEHKNYLRFWEPKIAVFAGSFNPFHIGHLNILEKAEKIFDKVIVASGQNPEKTNEKEELPNAIKNRQIEFYNGLLTDFLKGLGYPVTLIRGLRDEHDLAYESKQIAFLKDLMPEINVISILCDREYSHISSSAIRSLQKYNISDKYLLK